MKSDRVSLAAVLCTLIACLFGLAAVGEVFAQNEVDVSVTKTGAVNVLVNQPFTYTITADIPPPGVPSFHFTDTLPGGLSFNVTHSIPITCDPISGTVAIGQTQNISCFGDPATGGIISGTYPVFLRVIPLTPGVFTNTVEIVSSGEPDPNPSNNFSDHVTRVASGEEVDLSVTKTGPTEAVAGQPFTYTITLNSPFPGASGFYITETLPAGISYALSPPEGIICDPMSGTIAPGQSGFVICQKEQPLDAITGTFPIDIRVVPMSAGLLTNRVVVGGSTPPDPNPSNNADSVETTVSSKPSSALPVPTLRAWGMLAMLSIFAVTAIYFLRRRKIF